MEASMINMRNYFITYLKKTWANCNVFLFFIQVNQYDNADYARFSLSINQKWESIIKLAFVNNETLLSKRKMKQLNKKKKTP